jgi:hypothetical protein
VAVSAPDFRGSRRAMPQGKLALHEEFPDALAQAVMRFLADGS